MGDFRARRSIWGDLGRLLGGSVAGYVVLLLASPLITRLFAPEEFGVFAVFSGVVAVASVFMTSGFEMGVVNAQRRADSFRHLLMAVHSAVIAALIFVLLAGILAATGLHFGLPSWAMAAAILSCFMASLVTIVIAWSVKAQRMAKAAQLNFVSLSARSLGQIALGLLGFGAYGLILGEVLGRAFAAGFAEMRLILHALRSLLRRPAQALRRMWRARAYPLVFTPSVAIDTALVWVPAPLVAVLFDPYAAGLIALVQRFGSVPLTIANQSLGQVFHQRASAMHRTDPAALRRLFWIIAGAAFPAAVGVGAVFAIYGAPIMALLFGPAWAEAGFVAAALVPIYFVQFLAILGNRMLVVRGMLRAKLAFSALHLAMMVAVLLGASLLGATWQAALLMLAAGLCATYALSITLSFWRLGGPMLDEGGNLT